MVSFVGWSGHYTIRDDNFFVLGGGTGSVEGVFQFNVTNGVKIDLTPKAGVVARFGYAGALLGNDALYVSYFELPEAQIGYQYRDDEVVFEAGGRGGLVLDGRYNPGDHAERKIGTAPDAGGFAFVQASPVRVSVDAVRVLARTGHNARPVDIINSIGCFGLDIFVLCGDASLYRGEVSWGTSEKSSRSLYLGVLLGIGFVRNTMP